MAAKLVDKTNAPAKAKKQTGTKLIKWFKDNKFYLLAFFLSFIAITIVYALKDVSPFGNLMYLRSDCYHQYAPYLEDLRYKLRHGGSLLYTWQIGTGMNFLAISAYYLSSPFNLLIAIWPGEVSGFVDLSIAIKMGLAGFSTSYYLTKKYGKSSASTAIFGMFYALSAYFVAFSWNIMWLDCMWLLPFIILGIEKLVNERKCRMYCISLAVGIFSNYYIGIMLCIFSVIYFAYQFFTVEFADNVDRVKARLLIIKDYVLYSLLGGMLAMCVILPEYFNLLTTKSADTTFPATWDRYYSFLYMIFRSLMHIPAADLKYPYDPNIYCGMAMFLFIPLFWMCKQIKQKDKIGKTVIAILLLISFQFNVPNYIWHGFHFPNSLPCRESFIYIFILITMAYEAFIHIDEIKSRSIAAATGGSIVLILIFEEMFKGVDMFNDLAVSTNLNKIIYFSLIFLIIDTFIIIWYKAKPDLRGLTTYILLLAVFTELIFNFYVTGIPSASSKEAYYVSTPSFHSLNKVAKSDAASDGVLFFRTDEATNATRNDGARFSYNSVSTFSSVSSAAMQEFYQNIGLQTSFNAYAYQGHTPLTAAMLAIRYEYSDKECSIPETMNLIGNESYTNTDGTTYQLNLYRYNQPLQIGFMVDPALNDNWTSIGNSGDPFIAQNDFVDFAVPGSSNIFHRLTTESGTVANAIYDTESDPYGLTANKESEIDVYLYCVTSSESITVQVTGSNTSINKTFNATQQNYIIHVGPVSPGSKIELTPSSGHEISTTYAYAFDQEAWNKAYDALAASQYNVTSYSDTKLSGTVNAKQNGVMFTSIPYDKGWTAYVDGKKVQTKKLAKDALIGIDIPQGEHKVEFKYTPQGFIPGLLLTFLSLIVLIIIMNRKKIFKKLKIKDPFEEDRPIFPLLETDGK